MASDGARDEILSNWTTRNDDFRRLKIFRIGEGAVVVSPSGKEVCKYVPRLCCVEEFDVDRSFGCVSTT